MLSRDADACYWIGRYVERAEATARMIDVHYHAALETPVPLYPTEHGDPMGPIRWSSILAISGTAERYRAAYGEENDRDVLQFFASDLSNPSSILSTWRAARENARCIREQLASEMWEALNVAFLQLRQWDADRVLAGSPHEFFSLVKNASHLFQGILNRSMLMGEARDWLDTGRFLERGDQTARLLDVKYHDLLPAYLPKDGPGSGELPNGNGSLTPGVTVAGAQPAPIKDPFGVGGLLDIHGWIAVLKSVSAYEMYRKTYPEVRPARVVEFLVLHPQFPASMRHCVARVDGCIKRIGGGSRSDMANEAERLIGRLLADLTFARAEDIIVGGLHEYLDDVLTRCADIGRAITKTYLSY